MTMKNKMTLVHPGEILREELSELSMSARALAQSIKVPVNRVTAILNGERGITADTARRLGRYFDTSTEFWMNLQKDYEIRQAEIEDTSDVLQEIVPRQTVLLRDAVRDLNADSHFEPKVAETLETISSNLTLCTQLQRFEQSSRIGELTKEWMHAIAGPLSEIREEGVFDTKLSEYLPYTFESFSNYSNQFKSPSVRECERLEEEFARSADIAFDPPHPIFKHLDSPWLNELDELASMQRLINLQYMGDAVLACDPFEIQCSDSIRKLLGDWRDVITWPKTIWEDLGARVSFYEVLGFDVSLTDVPAPTFYQILDVTGIRSEPPSLIEAYVPLFQSSVDSDEERALARTNNANDWLQRLESQLRLFIDREMTQTFGTEWVDQQLPKAMARRWQSRRKTAEKTGAPNRPLLAYADFSDYAVIICQDDHWDRVFGRLFYRRESVRESLQRLYPIRNDTMHGRPITQDDELLLYAETKRLMSTINATNQTSEKVGGGECF